MYTHYSPLSSHSTLHLPSTWQVWPSSHPSTFLLSGYDNSILPSAQFPNFWNCFLSLCTQFCWHQLQNIQNMYGIGALFTFSANTAVVWNTVISPQINNHSNGVPGLPYCSSLIVVYCQQSSHGELFKYKLNHVTSLLNTQMAASFKQSWNQSPYKIL